MTTHTWYEAVRVCGRDENGKMLEWYEGERRASEREARADAVRLSKEFRGSAYQVIRRVITEMGPEVVKPPKVSPQTR